MSNKVTEFSLIKRISSIFPGNKKEVLKGIGDDTAVINGKDGVYRLYTCDSLVSGIHFSEKYSSFYHIGRKAVAVNISDIAAMGGQPNYMLVSLFLPDGISELNVKELYRGIKDECDSFQIDVIGGNITKSDQFIIDIFLTGEVVFAPPLFRCSAKAGDLVVVTGTLGDSALGLHLLKENKIKLDKHKKYLINRHLLPAPRVKEGQYIAKSNKVHAMIDISDGLSSDIGHICDESGIGVKIFIDKLPVSDSFSTVYKQLELNARGLILNGGEDYELCFTVAAGDAVLLLRNLKMQLKTECTVIGEILNNKNKRIIIDSKGKTFPLRSRGWDHFK